MASIRCPHCGAPVMLRGSRWECGYCGDFGSIASLQPSERAKLAPACAPSVRIPDTGGGEGGPPSPPRAGAGAGGAQDVGGGGADPPKTRHGPEGPKIISKKLLTNNNSSGTLKMKL